MKKIKYITLLALLILNYSCIKSEQKQTEEASIIDLLNQNKSDEALLKIEQEANKQETDELLYLKASALSMKAGVDIYALFPLLKVKIFDVAISQWSQNREFQKKEEAQRVGVSTNKDDINKSKNSTKSYKELSDEEIDFHLVNLGIGQINSDLCQLYIEVELEQKIFDYNTIWTQNILKDKDTCMEISSGKINQNNFEIPDYINLEIKNSIRKQHRDVWDGRNAEINKKDMYIKLLGSFWTLIDMIPMIDKIPKINKDGFGKLSDAQDILLKIQKTRPNKNDVLGKKAKKQLMMISALKILGHVQNSVNLEVVKSPIDLICNSNEDAANELLEAEKDALYLLNSVDDPEIINKNKEFFVQIKEKYQFLLNNEANNPEVYDRKVRLLKKAIEIGKKENCN